MLSKHVIQTKLNLIWISIVHTLQTRSNKAPLMTDTTTQDQQRYDSLSLILHWLTAFAVIAAFAIGAMGDFIPKGPEKIYWITLHKSLGVTVMMLTVVRLIWRFTGMKTLPTLGTSIQQLATKLGHGVLYFLLLLVPFSGSMMTWARGYDVGFFGLFTMPHLIEKNMEMATKAAQVHEIVGWAIIILAFGHAVLAIYHQAVLKDGTLKRMSLHG